ncbi:hypothetical protein DSUL_20176 [Desulfovibrionales bacterium]
MATIYEPIISPRRLANWSLALIARGQTFAIKIYGIPRHHQSTPKVDFAPPPRLDKKARSSCHDENGTML